MVEANYRRVTRLQAAMFTAPGPQPAVSFKVDMENEPNVFCTQLVFGSQVAICGFREQQSGAHRVSFNASPLPSGIYFYRLTAERVTAPHPTGDRALKQDTKKMIVLK